MKNLRIGDKVKFTGYATSTTRAFVSIEGIITHLDIDNVTVKSNNKYYQIQHLIAIEIIERTATLIDYETLTPDKIYSFSEVIIKEKNSQCFKATKKIKFSYIGGHWNQSTSFYRNGQMMDSSSSPITSSYSKLKRKEMFNF